MKVLKGVVVTRLRKQFELGARIDLMCKGRTICFALAFGFLTIHGCHWTNKKQAFQAAKDSFNPCCPDVTEPSPGPNQLDLTVPNLHFDCLDSIQAGISPLDVDLTTLTPADTLNLSLQECVQLSLENSRIMRDLGGTVLRSPQASITRNDPGLAFTDPRFGEQAALAEFDATLEASALFENNDRRLNNRFFGNQGLFRQDLHNYSAAIRKRSAAGGLMTVRNLTTYDANNQLSNAIGGSSFDQILETEIRQPLLQGAGTRFNRIAGPGARPGQINGVLIGRVRTDIALTDFEKGVRDVVADVENAYWDLYFAYRDLEAKVDARDIARITARKLENQTATQGTGDAAQAMEQYYRFESEVIDAINGRPIDGTRTNNGSAGGSFRGVGGLRIAERRLRLIIGMAITDGRIIRPSDDPAQAPILVDWHSSACQALDRREELRRQRWVIKQRELELIANRNFLKPTLDVIGRYRFRGFGKDLLNSNSDLSATANLLDGDYQEWLAGLEYIAPVGFRKAHAAVRNSQLAIRRDMDILREQERNVLFGLSNAINEMARSYDSMQLQENRLKEIVRQLQSLQARSESGQDPALDVLLETHRRLLDARLSYHQSRIDYQLAMRNVQYEKGTLLPYCSVNLTESISDAEAYYDARFFNSRHNTQP